MKNSLIRNDTAKQFRNIREILRMNHYKSKRNIIFNATIFLSIMALIRAFTLLVSKGE